VILEEVHDVALEVDVVSTRAPEGAQEAVAQLRGIARQVGVQLVAVRRVGVDLLDDDAPDAEIGHAVRPDRHGAAGRKPATQPRDPMRIAGET